MPDGIPVRFPLDGIKGFGPRPEVAGLLFAPQRIDAAGIVPVAFCVHGGGYDKCYFDIEVPGRDGYSMARYLAGHGVIVVAIDCLGTSDSARAEAAENVTSDMLAKAHHRVVGELVVGLRAGTLAPDIPSLPRLALTAIGHSLGGMLTIMQQAKFGSFDRVAILGWSNIGLALPPSALKPVFDETGTYAYSSPELRQAFHLPDVPPEVLACSAERTVFPVSLTLAAEAADRGTVRKAAESIAAPIFVGVGEHDTSPSPHDEAACYRKSGDITFFRLPGSAHCHNFATTRALLWDRLLAWMQQTV